MDVNPYESPARVEAKPADIRYKLLIASGLLFTLSVLAFCLILITGDSDVFPIAFRTAQTIFWGVFLVFLVVLRTTMLTFIAKDGARKK